ncbi:MnhG [Desulfamplus magnetovallimortis]|uniref:MnhG n=1 Tax=Desulfamplus magnetovallimortis TaxID=1246637 RepID=A0A1W1H909_9BACT|nr:monovalent cation/H(+) antiporter subunit G [Desulfamplus magnetovallimortis]SLM28933.1 MnhG [Desulfamplus magnetovallimortis]
MIILTSLVSGIMILAGLVFFLGGSIGMIRLPDFYSRLHSAGMLDTMGLMLTMGGMALYIIHDLTLNNVLSALKIILIVVFIFITSPTATHAIVDAGIRAGMKPWRKRGSEAGK